MRPKRGSNVYYFSEKVILDECWSTGRNPKSRPGRKQSQAESKYHMCRGPEATIGEGAAEEVGKGLKAKPRSLT